MWAQEREPNKLNNIREKQHITPIRPLDPETKIAHMMRLLQVAKKTKAAHYDISVTSIVDQDPAMIYDDSNRLIRW